MDELIDIYIQFLKTAWFLPDADGWVRTISHGETPSKQVTLAGQPLVLPTQEQLMKPAGKVFFHPLAEDVVQGESPVLAKVRHGLSLRVNSSLLWLISEMVLLSNSPAEHKKLSPRQSEVLSVFKNINDAGATKLRLLIDAAEKKYGSQGMLYSMYVSQRGKFKGKIHSRVGIASFPFYEELKKTDRPFDIEVSKTHRQAFIDMFEWLIPGIADTEEYNYASDSTVAPRLEAVFGTFGQIASLLNETLNKYADYLDVSSALLPVDWSSHLGNFENLRRAMQQVPPQSGSAGSEKRADVLAREQAIKPQGAQDTPPWEPLPTTAPTASPAATTPSGGLDYREAARAAQMRSHQPQHQQYAGYAQPQTLRPAANPHDFRAMAAAEAARQGRPMGGPALDAYGRPLQPMAPMQPVMGGYTNGI